MSYKPEFEVSGVWYDNAQRFATRQEAADSAQARFAVWSMPTNWRVVECADVVNYERGENGDERIVTNAAIVEVA